MSFMILAQNHRALLSGSDVVLQRIKNYIFIKDIRHTDLCDSLG